MIRTVQRTSGQTLEHEEFLEIIGAGVNDLFTLKLDGSNCAKLVYGSDVTIDSFVGACLSERVKNTGGRALCNLIVDASGRVAAG